MNNMMLRLQKDLSFYLSGSNDMNSALSLILEYLLLLPDVDGSGVYLYEPAGRRLILRYQKSVYDLNVNRSTELGVESDIFKSVMNGKTVYTDLSEKIIPDPEFNPGNKLKASAVIPIRYGSEILGALNPESHTVTEFPENIKAAMETIAVQTGLVIRRIGNDDMIRRNNKNLRELFDKINDFLFILDTSGHIIEINNVTRDMLGYQYEELIGLDVLVLHPEQRRREAADIFDDMLKGNTTVCRIPLVRKNGEEIPVETKVSTGIWSGEPAVFGISRNISERIAFEKIIKEGYDRLDLALKGANLGTWDWNIVTGAVVFNERWANMLGYSLDEIEMDISSWKKLVHPDDILTVMNNLNDHLDGKTEFYETEHRMISKDGSYRWIHDRGQIVEFDDNHKPIRAAGTHLDISDRKEIERQLAYREKFETIIMIISTEFILLSSDEVDEKIDYALRVIGEFVDVGRSYVFLFSDDMKRMSNTHEWCMPGITPQKNELQNIPVEAVPWWMDKIISGETLFIPRVDELPPEASTEKKILESQDIKSLLSLPISYGLDVIGFIGFDSVLTYKNWDRESVKLLRVVSEMFSNAIIRKRYENTIKSAREDADRANHAKSDFLANMSHELRTPMTAILGISKLLWTKINDNLTADQIEGLKLIYESGKRLLDLINDLLDLSKIEAGKMSVVRHSFSISGLIEKVEKTFAPLLGEKNVTFSVTRDAVPEYVISDQGLVFQIITNLIGNSIKFTEKGSISLKISQSDQKIYFEISDTGIGISGSDIRNIFEKFTQVESSLSKKYRGTGLGLAISKKLCELLSGGIYIESEVDSGTKATFYIPLVYGEDSNLQESFDYSQPLYENSGKHGATVLVVDDDYSSRISLKLLLDKYYNVLMADSGKTALEIYGKSHPEVVLLDITMPEFSGFDVFDSIRSLDSDKKTRIIAVTAHAMEEEKEYILEYGFNGYVSKPVDSEILFKEIVEV